MSTGLRQYVYLDGVICVVDAYFAEKVCLPFRSLSLLTTHNPLQQLQECEKSYEHDNYLKSVVIMV